MVSVGFGCTWVICCQGKEAKFQFREFPVPFFPEGAVVCLSHPQKQLWEQGMGREGLALPYVLGAGTRTSSPPCMNRKDSLVPVQHLAKSICACFLWQTGTALIRGWPHWSKSKVNLNQDPILNYGKSSCLAKSIETGQVYHTIHPCLTISKYLVRFFHEFDQSSLDPWEHLQHPLVRSPSAQLCVDYQKLFSVVYSFLSKYLKAILKGR